MLVSGVLGRWGFADSEDYVVHATDSQSPSPNGRMVGVREVGSCMDSRSSLHRRQWVESFMNRIASRTI